MSSPLVYAVVLTFNVRDMSKRCFESLRTLTYPNLRVLVVDNGSTDGTEEMARMDFPDFSVIQTGANLGYTGGNNRGIEDALRHEADYVLILNPDTVVVESAVHRRDGRLHGVAERHRHRRSTRLPS